MVPIDHLKQTLKHKLKVGLLVLAASSCLAMITMVVDMQQAKLGGAATMGGGGELSASSASPPSCGSIGASGRLQGSDGAGCFNDSGWYTYAGRLVNDTFSTTRIISHGGKSCPLFPDSSYWNTDTSTWDLDPLSSSYIGAFTYPSADFTQPPLPTISAASWSGGTVTATVSDSTHITNGGGYFIDGVSPSGYNSICTSLGNGCYATVHVIDGTHVSYPVTSNPGSYSGGGIIHIGWFRFGPVPSMYLNFADNTTATPAITWQAPGQVSDPGKYPLLPAFQVEGYNFGGNSDVSAGPYGGDNHVLAINMDTCVLYETFLLQNASSPYLNANGAIWDLRSNDLRTAHKVLWPGNDTSGLTSTDAAGLPVWPGVLQFSELRPDLSSNAAINHAVRITLTKGGSGWVWPATHNACSSLCLPDGPPYGARWRLRADFDVNTCHFQDCAGLPWPNYMKRLLTALQTYGAIFADGGLNVGITTDADQSWGDPNDPASYQYMLASWLHGIQWVNGDVVEPTAHVVNILSGATK